MRGFRVWNEREKTYDDGWDYLLSSDGNLYALKYGALVSMSGANYLTVEFDAGLKDKNGKEIYEWDIVQRGENQTAIVKWSQSNARFTAINVGSRRLMSFDDWTATHELIIIGNARENPELLEEK